MTRRKVLANGAVPLRKYSSGSHYEVSPDDAESSSIAAKYRRLQAACGCEESDDAAFTTEDSTAPELTGVRQECSQSR